MLETIKLKEENMKKIKWNAETLVAVERERERERERENLFIQLRILSFRK